MSIWSALPGGRAGNDLPDTSSAAGRSVAIAVEVVGQTHLVVGVLLHVDPLGQSGIRHQGRGKGLTPLGILANQAIHLLERKRHRQASEPPVRFGITQRLRSPAATRRRSCQRLAAMRIQRSPSCASRLPPAGRRLWIARATTHRKISGLISTRGCTPGAGGGEKPGPVQAGKVGLCWHGRRRHGRHAYGYGLRRAPQLTLATAQTIISRAKCFIGCIQKMSVPNVTGQRLPAWSGMANGRRSQLSGHGEVPMFLEVAAVQRVAFSAGWHAHACSWSTPNTIATKYLLELQKPVERVGHRGRAADGLGKPCPAA